MASKQSPSRMMIMLPMLFLMNKIDFENELLLNCARGAFVLCQVVWVITSLYIKNKIVEKNDQRKIRIPAVTSPFNPTPNYEDVTETTYQAHELAKVNEFIKQTLIGAAISSFIHVKMGVNHVVMIQSVMTPINLWDNPLVQAFILGKRDGRIWNEKLEGESLDAPPVEGGDAKTEAKDKKKAKKANGLPAVTATEAIAQALAAGADADFDDLWDAVKGDVNAKTKDDCWTALMVACGSPIDTDEFIRKVIAAGADVTAVDGDGWTALHWSAFHGRPEAAETLLECVAKNKLQKLLDVKASDGKTALETAQAEENDDVVEIIKKAAAGGAAGKTGKAKTDEWELRRRKGGASKANTTTTSVDDVD